MNTQTLQRLALLSGALAIGSDVWAQAPRTDAVQTETDEPLKLSRFVVTGQQETGYQASNTISATRTNLPISEIPVNISVLTNAFMQDFNAHDPVSALKYLGVGNSNSSVSNGGIDLDFTGQIFGRSIIRGLPSDWSLANGVRTNTALNQALVSRVELIRGPASVLYGLTRPGGVYNTISKQAVGGSSFGEATVQFGNYNNTYAMFDWNHSLSDTAAVRLVAFDRHQETEFAFNERDTRGISPMLTFNPFGNTTVSVAYLYQRDEANMPDQRHALSDPSPGYVPEGWTGPVNPEMAIPLYLHPKYIGRIDPRMSWAGPDSYRDITYEKVDLSVVQKISENLQFKYQLAYSYRDSEQRNNNIALINPGHPLFWIGTDEPQDPFFLVKWEGIDNKQENTGYVLTGLYDKELGLGRLGRLKNLFTFGFQSFKQQASRIDYVEQTDFRKRDASGNLILNPAIVPANVNNANGGILRQNWPALNGGIHDGRSTRPVGGVWFRYMPVLTTDVRRPDDVVINRLPPGVGSFAGAGNGSYVIDRHETAWLGWNGKMLDDRLVLMGGLYHTRIKNTDGLSYDAQNVNFDEQKNLPQYGAMFRLTKGLGLYALYSESLDANAGARNYLNETFPPISGEGKELGLKYEMFGGKVSGTFSLFDITLKNRVVFDPNAPNPSRSTGLGDNVARGLNTSKGFDFDLTWQPVRSFQVIFNYSKTDVESGGNIDPRDNGLAEIGSFEYAMSFITNYRFFEGRLKGLSVGLAAFYQDDYMLSLAIKKPEGTYQRFVPGQWDGSSFLAYETKVFGRTTIFRINVNNLFAKSRWVGMDPNKLNSFGYASQPYTFDTERYYTLAATVRF